MPATTRRITVFKNVPEVTSMHVYSEELVRNLRPQVNSGWEIGIYQPKMTQAFSRVHRFSKRVPLLRTYANDFLFSRYVKYPLVARWHQGDINHLCSDSLSHLLDFLDQRRTVITCTDLRPLKLELPESPALRFHIRSFGKIAKARRVICISETTKREALDFGLCDEGQTRVVYLGVDAAFRPIEDQAVLERTRKKYGLPQGKLLLHVGMNWEHKNIEGILRACRILMDSVPSLFLIKVGQDLSEQQKVLARSLGLEGRILSLGHIAHASEELVAIYNIADVLLLPSLNEGFGMPIVEAFACGTPVVTSNISCMPEIAGGCAVLVDPSDPGDIAKGISAALCDVDYRTRLRREGIERAKQFSWEIVARRTLAVYEEVLEEVLTHAGGRANS